MTTELDRTSEGSVANDRLSSFDWQSRIRDALTSKQPFIGHPLHPIPLRDNTPRTEKISTYVELEFLFFLEEYAARAGFRSISEVMRRLMVIGAMAEGYTFDEQNGESP